ncbi:MAG: glycosyltransferase family 2 protein [Chthoniobacteraceae bacterium]|nr:glycosyltransferase family 2 protein [Chthoniobacteraceae bacterium]
MKISVVVPSYQQGRFIGQTLDSLLNQNYPDLEVLVFDGGSTDETVEVLQSYGDRIRAVSRKDHGQTDAINQGMRQASGEILAYLNSDDVYLPGTLERVARYFEDNPDALILYGQAYYLNADGSVMKRYASEPWSYRRLLDVCYICQPAVFWRREVMDRFGVFDDRLDLAMDYDYWLRVGRHVPFAYLEDAYLAGSRLHADTKTLSQCVKVNHEVLQVVMRYAPEPPVAWLLSLARAIVVHQKASSFRGKMAHKLKRALIMETVMEQAEHYQFPIGKSLLERMERIL